jgi:hypothetical protein
MLEITVIRALRIDQDHCSRIVRECSRPRRQYSEYYSEQATDCSKRLQNLPYVII